jgi:formylglycine-generating enzyme required for sulfatase activity
MKTFLCAILLLFPAVGAWYPSAPSCADAPSTASLLTPPRSGRDLALFFATDTYTHSSAWRKLYAPVRDAKAIAADLHDLYGFDTMVVMNPTRNRVREVLAQYATKKYNTDNQLLVYFTGHGQYIDLVKDGFYIPKDGKPSKDDPYGDTWLKYTDLRRTISGINCPHILLCVDACFSGTLDEGIVFGHMNEKDDFDRPNEADFERNSRIVNMLRPGTRLLISSGRKDYVPDPSEFANLFKSGLRSLGGPDGLLDVHALYHSYLKKAPSQPILRSFEQDETASTFIFDYRSRTPSATPQGLPPTEQTRSAPDRDYDGIPDATDPCPDDYGTLRGCPDTDGDGVPDRDDQCPYEPGTNASGCPVRDRDSDGVADAADKCPDAYGKKEWQGCPDTDADGIPDHKDDCPNEKGLPDLKGCPEKNADTYTDPFAGTFVRIKGGSFDMGSNDGESDEKPVHRVTLGEYYLSKHEVTVTQFKAFVDDTGHQTDAEKGDGSYAWTGSTWEKKTGVDWRCDVEGKRRPASEYNHPVVHVSWNDAAAYAQWVSRKTGERYRLPTEAEWEYAAGNGSRHTKYSWGNSDPSGKRGGNVADETAKARFSTWTIFTGYTDGYVFTAPVGAFDPNDFGLHDMTGNVWEWCADWYGSDYYGSSPAANPTGPTSGSARVLRGGSWYGDPAVCRVADRYGSAPDGRDDYVGFRLARTF